MLCCEARPPRMTVASGGVMSAGGPAIRIEGESVSSGSSPYRFQAANAKPSVTISASRLPGMPISALAVRYSCSSETRAGVISASTWSMAATNPRPTSPA